MSGADRDAAWNGLNALMEAGGLGELSPSDAFNAISNAIDGVDGLDGDGRQLVEQGLVDAYVDAAYPKMLVAGLAAGDSVRAREDAAVIPALCRASGVGPDVYGMAAAMRDEGDDSLMLDMYSAFVVGLVRGVRRGRR